MQSAVSEPFSEAVAHASPWLADWLSPEGLLSAGMLGLACGVVFVGFVTISLAPIGATSLMFSVGRVSRIRVGVSA